MIGSTPLRLVVAAALACAAMPAAACSPPQIDTRTPAQVDADVRRQFDAARDVVRIRMVATATPLRDGKAVVLRSLKGTMEAGTSIRIHTTAGPACGYGDAPRGTTHLLYLNGRDPAAFAPMQPNLTAILRRLRLLPADWR